jgi:hypothetical protein
MFRVRLLLVPLAAAVVLVLAGALSTPSAAPARSAPSVPSSATADSAAVQTLDRAVEALGPARVRWLETAVWQRVQVEDLVYQAEGRYQAGPDRRFRLELQTRLGSTTSQLRLVSDGRSIHQASRLDQTAWNLQPPMELPAGAGRKAAPPFDVFLQNQLAGGPSALLEQLREHLVWVRKETVRRQEHKYFRLTAVRLQASTSEPAPAGVLRQARLYLDAQTLWPHRLEWWGADGRRAGDALLLQMELRSPVVNRPLSAAQCARVFALDLGAD